MGTIGQYLARFCEKVVGVESHPSAVDDALQSAGDWMQTAALATATGQGHVEGFGSQLRLQGDLLQRLAPGVQRRLDAVLGSVDRCALAAALFRRQLAQAFQQFGQAARLAEKARLGLLELRRIGYAGELSRSFGDQLLDILHVDF